MFAGGLPNGKLMTAGKFPYTFTGCISDVTIGDSTPMTLSEHAVRAVNVQPCEL